MMERHVRISPSPSSLSSSALGNSSSVIPCRSSNNTTPEVRPSKIPRLHRPHPRHARGQETPHTHQRSAAAVHEERTGNQHVLDQIVWLYERDQNEHNRVLEEQLHKWEEEREETRGNHELKMNEMKKSINVAARSYQEQILERKKKQHETEHALNKQKEEMNVRNSTLYQAKKREEARAQELQEKLSAEHDATVKVLLEKDAVSNLNVSLHRDKSAAEERTTRLEEENSKQKSNFERCLTRKEELVTELKARAEQLLNKTKDLQQMKQQLQADNGSLQERQTELGEKLCNLDTSYSGLQTRYNLLETNHSQLKTEHTYLLSTHESLQSEHRELEASHSRLQAEHTSIYNGLTNFQEKYENMAEDYQQLHIKYEETEAKSHKDEKKYKRLVENHLALTCTVNTTHERNYQLEREQQGASDRENRATLKECILELQLDRERERERQRERQRERELTAHMNSAGQGSLQLLTNGNATSRNLTGCDRDMALIRTRRQVGTQIARRDVDGMMQVVDDILRRNVCYF